MLSAIWANDIYRKLILSVLVIIGQGVLHRLLPWLLLTRLPADSPYAYPLRKTMSYAVNAVMILLLFSIWIVRIGDLSVALGIMAAGLAFALQETIGSFAGWLSIIMGRPFTIGDRIEAGGIRGDVVDVGLLRTTLMEIGNWLHGDHNTGRIVTLSNAYIFKEPLYNYTVHLHYIWDEISIPVKYESDWTRAIGIMQASVEEHPGYVSLLPRAKEQRDRARRKLAVRITPLDPRVFVSLTDNWVELGLVYPVDTDSRRTFRSEISQRILSQFAEAGIAVASQTLAIVEFPSTERRPA